MGKYHILGTTLSAGDTMKSKDKTQNTKEQTIWDRHEYQAAQKQGQQKVESKQTGFQPALPCSNSCDLFQSN